MNKIKHFHFSTLLQVGLSEIVLCWQFEIPNNNPTTVKFKTDLIKTVSLLTAVSRSQPLPPNKNKDNTVLHQSLELVIFINIKLNTRFPIRNPISPTPLHLDHKFKI